MGSAQHKETRGIWLQAHPRCPRVPLLRFVFGKKVLPTQLSRFDLPNLGISPFTDAAEFSQGILEDALKKEQGVMFTFPFMNMFMYRDRS